MGLWADDAGTVEFVAGSAGACVTVQGEIDLRAQDRFGEILAQLGTDPSDVQVDLRLVTFFSSHGLTFIARLASQAVATGHEVTVTNPSPMVQRTLRIAGLDRLVRLVDDERRTGTSRH